MARTILTRVGAAFLIVLMLVWASSGRSVVMAQDPRIGPTPNAKFVLGNDQWRIYSYERGDGSYNPAVNYNYLVAKQEFGDSGLTLAQRKSKFNSFIQALGWKNTDLAAVTVKADTTPELPILAIQKDANDSLLKPTAGEWRVSGLRTFLPGNGPTVTVSISGGNNVESTIVANALEAVKDVAGVLGAGPAVRTLNAIPAKAITSLDTFARKIAGGSSQATPTLSIDGATLRRQPTYEFLFYDKAVDKGGKVIVKVTVEAKSQASLFGELVPNPGPSYFNTILHAPLDGKTEQDGGKSLYKEIQSNQVLFSSFSSERYDQYYSLCDQLPGYLAGFGLVPSDVTLAQYAFLMAAKGNGAERTGGLRVCPDGGVSADMRKMGFGPLPAETLDSRLKTERAQVRVEQNAIFSKISTAIAQAQGLPDLCQGTVMFSQSIKVVPGVPLSRDVARGDDEIGEMFVGLANGKPNVVHMGKFDFSQQGQLSAHAILRVDSTTGGDAARYRITVVLNSENKIQRISLEALEG